MSNNTNNSNKDHTTFILYIVVCTTSLLALIAIYFYYTNSIKKSIDDSIGKFETNSQIQLSNYYELLKETITNESSSNKEFIKDTLEEAFKPNIDLLRETLRDTKEFGINTVTFWLAFLSLSMIIFTILGIYSNNKSIEFNKENIKSMEEKLVSIEEASKKITIDMYVSKARKEEIDEEYDKAIDSYSEILKLDEDNLDILNSRALLYSKKYENEKYDEYFNKSVEDYDKIIKNDDHNNKALLGRAWLYTKKYEYSLGKNDEAYEYFNKAIKDYGNISNEKDKLDSIAWLYYIKYEHTTSDDDYNKSINYYNYLFNSTSSNIINTDTYNNILNNILNLYRLKYIENYTLLKDIFSIDKILENSINHKKTNIDTKSIIDSCEKIMKRSNNNSDINKNALYIMYSMCLVKYNDENDENYLDKAIQYAENDIQIDNINLDTLKNISALYCYKYKCAKGMNLFYLEKAESYLSKLVNFSKDKEMIKNNSKYLSCIYKEYYKNGGKNINKIFDISENECKNLADKYNK